MMTDTSVYNHQIIPMQYYCVQKMPAFFFKVSSAHLDTFLSVLQCNNIHKFNATFVGKQSYEYNIITMYNSEDVGIVKSFLYQNWNEWEHDITIICGEVDASDIVSQTRYCPSPIVHQEVENDVVSNSKDAHEQDKRTRAIMDDDIDIFDSDDEGDGGDLLPLPKRMRVWQ